MGFNKNMLISLVLGLIEENTGVVYFINAEHPNIVLYRNEKAEFIKEQKIGHKLGMSTSEDILLNLFKMKENDTIIVGSDGKDDIRLKSSENKASEINQDEKLFLRLVEKGKEDLKKIFILTMKKGNITDDYSIIKVKYKQKKKVYITKRLSDADKRKVDKLLESSKKAFQRGDVTESEVLLAKSVDIYKSSQALLIAPIQMMLKLKQYQKAFEALIEYSNHYPEKNSILFWISYTAKHIKNIKVAIDYSERLRLREPNNKRNLIHLVRLYLISKNKSRASLFLNQIKQIDPAYPPLKTLNLIK